MAPKEQASFIAELKDMGLVVDTGSRQHYKVYTKDGIWVMDFAHSPSDRNWRKVATRQLRHKLNLIYG